MERNRFKPERKISPESELSSLERERKFLHPFKATTPQGNKIEGLIYSKPDFNLGSLIIQKLNGERTNQKIMSMPRIEYPYRENKLDIDLPLNTVDVRFTKKIDGTCIIFCPLKDKQGNIIEVFPKTRLTPVLYPNKYRDWKALLNEALAPSQQAEIERIVRSQNITLCGELYGWKNPHLISYKEGIKFVVHTAIRGKNILSYQQLKAVLSGSSLECVENLEKLPKDKKAIEQRYLYFQEKMQRENDQAGKGIFLHEGAILVISTPNTARYYKCKPPELEEIHRARRSKITEAIVWHNIYKIPENIFRRPMDSADISLGELEEKLYFLLKIDYPEEVIKRDEKIIKKDAGFSIHKALRTE